MESIRKYYRILGPGLLYAGAAVGVSHLVQSTRAGAEFGYQLIIFVVLANLIKYPFLEVAPRYTAAMGESLLHGYRRMGRWVVAMVATMTLLTMFTVQAAVTVVTAGVAIEVFGLSASPVMVSAGILFVCGVVLLIGRYSLLDHLIKYIILILTLTTIVALVAAFQGSRDTGFENPFDWGDAKHIFFLVALVGWMPAPLDISVWQSIWAHSKKTECGHESSFKECLLDFNVGFVATMVLATFFVALGALVMYGSGQTFSASGGAFAKQFIQLYTSTLGGWAYPIVALAALTTMASTSLTCLDIFPRIMRYSGALLVPTWKQDSQKAYFNWLVVTAVGAILLLSLFATNMRTMVDLATTLSFVLGPFYAILNHILIRRSEVPAEHRQGPLLSAASYFGIAALSLFSLGFLWIRYF